MRFHTIPRRNRTWHNGLVSPFCYGISAVAWYGTPLSGAMVFRTGIGWYGTPIAECCRTCTAKGRPSGCDFDREQPCRPDGRRHRWWPHIIGSSTACEQRQLGEEVLENESTVNAVVDAYRWARRYESSGAVRLDQWCRRVMEFAAIMLHRQADGGRISQ